MTPDQINEVEVTDRGFVYKGNLIVAVSGLSEEVEKVEPRVLVGEIVWKQPEDTVVLLKSIEKIEKVIDQVEKIEPVIVQVEEIEKLETKNEDYGGKFVDKGTLVTELPKISEDLEEKKTVFVTEPAIDEVIEETEPRPAVSEAKKELVKRQSNNRKKK